MAALDINEVNPRYLWLDPASGKTGNRQIRGLRARSAIVVVGSTSDSKIWVLETWADRVGTNTIVDKFIDICSRWRPIVAAYEDMAQQSLLADPIQSKAEEIGMYVPLSPITVNTKVDKNWRIRNTLQPVIGAGRLMIGGHLDDLRNELMNFPMSAVRDLVDALAGAVSLVPPPAASQQNHDEAREVASYLRNAGASPQVIESTVAELGGYMTPDHRPAWQRKMQENNFNYTFR